MEVVFIILIVIALCVVFNYKKKATNESITQKVQEEVKEKELNERIANEIIKNIHIEVTEGSGRRNDEIFNSLKKDYFQNKKIACLVKECEEFGKQSFPLYRKGYESNMPSMDFSLFIKELISSMDTETLISFLEYYGRDDFEALYGHTYSCVDSEIKRYGESILRKYGFEVVEDEDDDKIEFTKNNKVRSFLKGHMLPMEYEHFINLESKRKEISLKETIYDILSMDIDQCFISEKNMYLDFKAFLSLNYNTNSTDRRFVWTDCSHSDNHILYYSLGIYNYNEGPMIDQLIDKYNFWLKWTKEANNWYEDQMYIQKDILNFNYYQPKTDFYEKVKSLGLGERAYLLYDYTYRTNIGVWEGESYYATRSFGINEEKCLNKLKSMDILVESTDLRYVVNKLTKQELLDEATANGIDLKKSWTKDKMYDHLIQTTEGVKLLNDYLSQMNLVCLNKKYESDMINLLNHIESNIPIIQLLCLI